MSDPHNWAGEGIPLTSSEPADVTSTDDCVEFEIGPALDAFRDVREAVGAAAQRPARDGVRTPRNEHTVMRVVATLFRQRLARSSVQALPAIGLLAVGFHSAAPIKRGPLEGAWQRVAETYLGPDTSWTIRGPQPSVYLFTKNYYSMMWVPGTKPRGRLTSGAAVERLWAFESFRANSGTYEVRDSVVTVHPVVARIPNLVDVPSLTYVYRTRGDSLWLTISYTVAPDWTRTARVSVLLKQLE